MNISKPIKVTSTDAMTDIVLKELEQAKDMWQFVFDKWLHATNEKESAKYKERMSSYIGDQVLLERLLAKNSN